MKSVKLGLVISPGLTTGFGPSTPCCAYVNNELAVQGHLPALQTLTSSIKVKMFSRLWLLGYSGRWTICGNLGPFRYYRVSKLANQRSGLSSLGFCRSASEAPQTRQIKTQRFNSR